MLTHLCFVAAAGQGHCQMLKVLDLIHGTGKLHIEDLQPQAQIKSAC